MSQPQKIGRLAFRREGEFWNAYLAKQGTMEGATLMGSIKMALVAEGSPAKAMFMDLMREAFSEMTFQVLGVRATFPDGPEPLPEHERAGHS